MRAKVTSKGQITIPRYMRKLLRIGPGDSVVFESDDKGVHVRPASRSKSLRNTGALAHRGFPQGEPP